MRCLPCFVVVLVSCYVFAQPTQSRSDLDTIHSWVEIDGVQYRTIITRPALGARHPGVLLIGGLGCYSLGNLKADDPYAQLLSGLTRRGYVTMRVEKNGEGGSGGPACDSPQSDLRLAVRRSLAGLRALAASEYVDPSKIFVLAHSIGPIEGVFAAQEFPVRGFIAAETIGKGWIEYQLANTRRQMLMFDEPYDTTERFVRTLYECQYRFFVKKEPSAEIVKDRPACKESLSTFGVSDTYLQQIADVNIAAEWKKVDVPVLVTWGTSDPTTTAEENQYLVAAINSFHPGRATYAQFPGMGHGLDLAASPRAWLEAIQKHHHGSFDVAFLGRVDAWMKGVMSNTLAQDDLGEKPIADGLGKTASSQSPILDSVLGIGEFVEDWQISKQFTIDVANLMPAEFYTFKPNAEEMSFGEQMAHIADSNVFRFEQISGIKPPYTVDLSRKRPSDKETVLKDLQQSFDYVIAVLPQITPTQLERAWHLKSWKGRTDPDGRAMIVNMFVHTAHHRAQCEVYLRVKGIKPPDYTF